jgi:hypothetical protein
MSYYIIPKTNNDIYFNPIFSIDAMHCNDEYLPYISHTLYNYYNEAMNELHSFFAQNMDDKFATSYTLEDFVKIINPYEYIFSIVPGSKFSVGKLKPKTNLFYDLLEIITTLNVLDSRLLEMQSLIITQNYDDVIQCVELLRENSNDTNDYFNEIKDTLETTSKKGSLYNFIFFEAYNGVHHIYIRNLIHMIMVIFKRMASGGTCIIKIDCIFHKPVIDVLYFLTSCFEKVYIIKPNTNNVTTFEKYIVCKHFLINENKRNVYNKNYDILVNFLNKIVNNTLALINANTPCHFINKLNDINTIIGQQQLESLHHILNILKSRNKDDKIDLLKKTHIQKSVIWCEKFKLPCNKFTEKTNIFLPIVKDDDESKEEIDRFEPKFYIEDAVEIETELNI